jgi:uncharacterized membrane protein YkvA (DUF1232 family)
MRRLFRLWRLSGQDLRLLFGLLRSPNRPAWLIPALLALGVFGLEPFNFALPALGFVDDLVILPLIVRALAKFALRADASSEAQDPRVVSNQ